MAPKKTTVKKPAAKTVVKPEKAEKEVEITATPAVWKKVQTAEGWKRGMKKAMGKK